MNSSSFVGDFSSQVNKYLCDVNALKQEIEDLKVFKKYFCNFYVTCYACKYHSTGPVALDTNWIYCDCSISDIKLFCSIECYNDINYHSHSGKVYPPKRLK